MYKANIRKPSLRTSLLLGAASVAALAVAAPAMAQDDSSVETVVVTGSRIPQQGLYSISPVTAVGKEEMKLSGTTNVVDLLNSLPSVSVDLNGNTDNSTAYISTVNLRGLGSARTLVLVNGSRLMPGDPVVPVADLNVIPAGLVDHVEVLTGGASAVYGADAVAGVVNFILRSDFEGVEVTGGVGAYQHNNDNGYAQSRIESAGFVEPLTGTPYHAPTGSVFDGSDQNISLLMGVNAPNGKGNITVFAGYQHQAGVLQGTRDFASCQFRTTSKNTNRGCAGSATFALHTSADNYAAGVNLGQSSIGYFNTGNGTKGGGKFVPFTGAANQYFNFAPQQWMLRPDTRYSAGFEGHYQVNKAFEVYSDFLFMDDDSTAQLGPSGIFQGTGPDSGAYDVNCTNPYLSQQENFLLCGQTPGSKLGTNAAIIAALGHPYYDGAGNITPGISADLIARRNVEGGPRTYNIRHEAYRIKIGARGDLGGGWSYDVYGQLGSTNFTEHDGGQLLLSNVINALQVDPLTGNCVNKAAAGCVGLDIFGGFGAPSQAALNYIAAPSITTGSTQELVMSGSVTGDLGAWGIQSPWAKSPVALSLGGEYRQEDLTLLPDLANQQGLFIGGSPNPPIKGSYNVTEGFTEVRVPVIQGMPFAEDLTLNGGFRYSSYNTSGANITYKYGAEWQPIDDIRFRGSFERAVRAPNVVELFQDAALGLFDGIDPCSAKGAPTATVAAHCESAPGAAAVPAASVGGGLLNCPSSQCIQYGGGNRSLKPEVADTRSVGFVFTPTFFDGFTATVDYYDIKVDGAVGAIDPNVTLAQCYGPSATAASQAAFCPYIHRTAGTHTIKVNTTVLATSGYVQANNTNTGSLATKGIDFESHYNVDLGDWGMRDSGSLSFGFIGNWTQTSKIEPVSGLGVYDCAGLYGKTCGVVPSWKHKLRVTWATPWDVSLSVNWRHVNSVTLDSNSSQALLAGTPTPVDNKLDAMNYIDLAATWNIRDNVDITGGINNVFDKDPPLTTKDPSATNTFPGNYDVLGRYMFLQTTVKF